MDLCGPIRVESIKGKWNVLVIADDYSLYTWVHFLRSKDEAPEEIKTFLKKITVLLQAPVIIVRTDNDTKFKNQVLKEYFNSVSISHQASSVRTLQQNGVVEQRNQTLVEASRTMLILSRAPLFLWAEAIATAALCYPKNNHGDIGKLGAKGDIGFFIGYSATFCAYRVYNRQRKKIMETINTLATSTTITATIPTPTNSSSQATNIRNTSQDVDELELQQHVQQQENQTPLQLKTVANNVLNAMLDEKTFVNPFAPPSINGDMCIYALTASTMKPKNVKEAMTDPAWIESMQEELLQLKMLDVWVLVPAPDNINGYSKTRMMKRTRSSETRLVWL
uniref:Integrase catalytic domain-containing protein n=1 Tax=Tanacetum cinerariifolium TaxID=118510 RepID=A0A6L2LHT4_TANCI|nr:hypothetical protein [Tanacetum cinerariifolium]